MILLTRVLDLTINKSHDSCLAIFLTTFYYFRTVISHTALKKLAFFKSYLLRWWGWTFLFEISPWKKYRKCQYVLYKCRLEVCLNQKVNLSVSGKATFDTLWIIFSMTALDQIILLLILTGLSGYSLILVKTVYCFTHSLASFLRGQLL